MKLKTFKIFKNDFASTRNLFPQKNCVALAPYYANIYASAEGPALSTIYLKFSQLKCSKCQKFLPYNIPKVFLTQFDTFF